MFQTLMITFREGLEAFLIIAISLIYLAQTNRRELIPAVHSGVGLALLLSALLGIILARIGAISSFWMGTMALIAAVSVVYCTVHMSKMGKFMKQEITNGFNKASGQSSGRAWMIAFFFSAFMVGREGVETATMIASLAAQAETSFMAIGAALGVLLASILAWAWVKFGRRINLQKFFQFTAVFMTIFALQLTFYAFHEFTEAGAVPLVDNDYWHAATEPLSPEGEYNQWISYSFGILPLGWLIYAYFSDRKANAAKLAP